ncbi:hypothetical protein SCHPADRAFT_901435 [Schizopora paradoxa]|uniref:F-box domain-containing protein n=1 Tax=Schizopora paradoxa TaxID=27342 RepID=A0A0H2RXJ6_9AGAM|nr:hypothetical protein SCHPADRAFT_901435 [Schizopora paradoxa]
MAPKSTVRRSTTLMVPEILTRVLEFAIAKGEFDCNYIKLYHIFDDIEPSSDILENFLGDTLQTYLTVCKTWYEIITSTPALWATFSTVLRFPQPSHIAHMSSMLDMHFRRSKAVPFTLFFLTIMEGKNGVVNEPLSAALRMLERAFTQQGHRLETVYLVMSVSETSEDPTQLYDHDQIQRPAGFTVLPVDMPVLKSLDFHLTFPRSYLDRAFQVKLAPHTHLEYIHIYGEIEISVPNPSLVTATFPNLRNLSLRTQDTKSFSDAWAIVRGSPNIEVLHLDCQRHHSPLTAEFNSYFDVTSAPAFHSLPRLQSLDVTSGFAATSLDVLNRVSLPSLTSLKLGNFLFDNHSLTELATLLVHYPLESFMLEIGTIKDSSYEVAFEAVINSLISVKRLELIFTVLIVTNQKPFLEALTNILDQEGPSEAPTLPALQDLWFIFTVTETSDWHGTLRNIISIVSICRRKYPSEFSIHFLITPWSLEGIEIVEHSLLEDTNIRRCISKTFEVSVNGKCVECLETRNLT